MESYTMVNVGSVHGRFQPFHNDHLEYILEAKKRCKFLWIGITKHDLIEQNKYLNSSHRNGAYSNPYKYGDRVRMIRASLLSNGVEQDEFEFTPFPIDTPDLMKNFLPTSVHCYTTIREKWNITKINILKELGYTVEVLWEDYSPKKVSGSVIRELIMAGNDQWEAFVPAPVRKIIKELQIEKNS